MENFINTYQSELIYTGILLIILLIVRFIIKISIKKIGRKSNINEARIGLISRYASVTLFLIAILIESFILGVSPADIALVFSSVFAVIGIALFAIWSILSNITSGVIMFFSFPYKVGDKIQIHDKDFPIEAIVEDIRAFHLHLRLDNGDLVTYPNNLILQKAVTLIEKDAINDALNDAFNAVSEDL
jgi:MscS family membrane protein